MWYTSWHQLVPFILNPFPANNSRPLDSKHTEELQNLKNKQWKMSRPQFKLMTSSLFKFKYDWTLLDCVASVHHGNSDCCLFLPSASYSMAMEACLLHAQVVHGPANGPMQIWLLLPPTSPLVTPGQWWRLHPTGPPPRRMCVGTTRTAARQAAAPVGSAAARQRRQSQRPAGRPQR